MKDKYIIGIDPDLTACGVASVKNNKLLMCETVKLWNLFLYLKEFVSYNENYIILLEAGHLNKNCWHKGGRGASSNVGKGKAIGVLLEAFFKEYNINYRNITPAGYSNFFKDVNFFKKQTGWEKSTNKDARAAAAIAWLNK